MVTQVTSEVVIARVDLKGTGCHPLKLSNNVTLWTFTVN
jgi:hypothetical protein